MWGTFYSHASFHGGNCATQWQGRKYEKDSAVPVARCGGCQGSRARQIRRDRLPLHQPRANGQPETHKDKIQEQYSIIKPGADSMIDCQKASVPTGAMDVLALSAFLLSTLNVEQSLETVNPCARWGETR